MLERYFKQCIFCDFRIKCLSFLFFYSFAILGASFLIPYILMLFVVGLPAMLIELSAGQYARVGANKVFGRMVPAFKVRIKKTYIHRVIL